MQRLLQQGRQDPEPIHSSTLSDTAEALPSGDLARLPPLRVMHGATPPDACRPLIAKRLLDVVTASLLLVFFLPIILSAAALVRFTSPGPALFRQTRIGRGGKPFTLLKLRTMFVDCDDSRHRDYNTREIRGELDAADGLYKLPDDPRITTVGRFLRQYSIDELPQLWNVMKGDMSLVGPRPALPWEVELFAPRYQRRHDCLPGITGLWQVSGRNQLAMPQMLELDLSYVERRTLLLDLWIILRTPLVVFSSRGTR
jgi:lipopolysaccharide/colanic/teichoic acid biosynthesis glycosyltransferase